MFRNRKHRRSGRPGYRPLVELFEKRELLTTASPFIQGTAFVDSSNTGTLTPTDPPLPGATIELLSGPTVIGTTTTGADGGYLFNDSNVSTPLAGGSTYTVEEIAPAGYAATKASGLSQVDPFSVTAANAIQVTAVDPNTVSATLVGNGSPYDAINFSLNGTASVAAVTPLYFNLTANGTTLASSPITSYCVGLLDDLSYNTPFQTLVDPQSALTGPTIGGEVGYLFNHYGVALPPAAQLPAAIQSLPTVDVAGGLQVAIWELEYGQSLTLTGPDTAFGTTQASYNNVLAAASAFVADAAGKSEKIDVLDASLTGSLPSNSATAGGQSVLAAQSFDFGNAPLPTGSISGTVFVDATNSGTIAPTDATLANVPVTLTGTVNGSPIVPSTIDTGSNGTYTFGNLPAGTYTVTEGVVSNYLPDKTNTGPLSNIVLAAGATSPNHNFGEIQPVTITGTVYLDATGNGLTGPNNSPPATTPADTPEAGVTVTLTGTVNGVAITPEKTVTGANGTYSFANLPTGSYSVSETTPSGYVETFPTGNLYTVAATTQGATYPNNNFANFMAACNAADLTNIVYTDNGCAIPGLRGHTQQGSTVAVRFTVPNGVTETLSLVAYEAPGSSFSASNAYQQQITDVQTGTFTGGTHTLTVTVPNSYYQVDFVCGSPITTFGPANGNIFYSAEGRLIDADNNGCQAYATSSLSGIVYFDANGNGSCGSTDQRIANDTVTLTGVTWTGQSVTLTTQTASNGTYSFANLAPGDYTITEAIPGGETAEGSNVGNDGGTAGTGSTSSIELNSNTTATGYNFGNKKSGGWWW